MQRDEALKILLNNKEEIVRRFGVKRLALFGSTARNQAGQNSDVDILVEFEGAASFRGYFDLQFFLEDRFHCEVDLVCSDSIRPRLKPIIEREAVYVA